MNNNRIILLDTIRGVAVLSMVLFHYYFYILYLNFGIEGLYSYNNSYIDFLGNFIRIIFLCLVGVSFRLSFNNANNNKVFFLEKQAKRFFIIAFFAFLYSFFTYNFLNDYMIYWGILHLIALSSFFLLIFFYSKISFCILFLIFFYLSIKYDFISSVVIGDKILFNSIDFFPLFPWIILVFTGYYAADYFFKFLGLTQKKFPLLASKNVLSYLGSNSLAVYLLHMPIFVILMFFLDVII